MNTPVRAPGGLSDEFSSAKMVLFAKLRIAHFHKEEVYMTTALTEFHRAQWSHPTFKSIEMKSAIVDLSLVELAHRHRSTA